MPPLLVGQPVTFTIPCAGLDPGSKVTVSVFEPHAMGGDPIEKFDATVADDGGEATAQWTYDAAKHKDTVAASVFVFVVEGAGRTTIAGPVAFVDRFEASVKDGAGHPAAFRAVTLHAARGESVAAETDGKGTVKALVPPGDYVVELCEPLPPERVEQLKAQEAALGTAADGKKDDAADADDAEPDDAGDDDADAATEKKLHCLSVLFLCVDGTPARNKAFTVEGAQGKTGRDGKAFLPDMPWRSLEVKFAEGTARIPAVHDPALVLVAWLPFLDPPAAAGTDSGDDAPAVPYDQVARPPSLFPAGDEGDIDQADPDPGDAPSVTPSVHGSMDSSSTGDDT
jgi:hypothetical protein